MFALVAHILKLESTHGLGMSFARLVQSCPRLVRIVRGLTTEWSISTTLQDFSRIHFLATLRLRALALVGWKLGMPLQLVAALGFLPYGLPSTATNIFKSSKRDNL